MRDRDFACYLAAVSASTLGSGMAIVALAFAVLDLGGATDLGLVLLAREIPLVVFVLLGGVFADRVPRHRILVGCDVVRAGAQAVTAALLLVNLADVWSIAALQMAFGVAGAFARPATTGIVRELVLDAQLQQANALASLSRSSLSIAGPALGGVVVTVASPAWALAADSATFSVSALLLAAMRLPPAVRTSATSILGDLRDGWDEFISRSWVVVMVASFGLFQLTFFPALLVLGPLVAKEQLGGAAAWGTVLAVQSVGAVLGSVVALRLKVGRPLVATILVSMPSAILLAALAFPLMVVAIACTAFAAGVGLSISDTLWFTALQRHIPEHALSRVSSFDWLGSVALNPIGYALIGPLAAAVGTAETLALATCLNLALSFGVLLVPSVRSLRSAPMQTDARLAVR